ncbi:MAG: AzlD domain-containing protein [Bacteroidales bacterium]|nr:AzlD domain-containing protein [Bacteroidales bacterium]
MQHIAIAMLIMALTTYLIRVIPIGFVRKKMENEWVQDFLYYIPFCVLSAMTFPDVLYSTTPAGATSPHFASAAIATMVAIVLAWKDKGLVRVALVSVVAAIIIEIILPVIF